MYTVLVFADLYHVYLSKIAIILHMHKAFKKGEENVHYVRSDLSVYRYI